MEGCGGGSGKLAIATFAISPHGIILCDDINLVQLCSSESDFGSRDEKAKCSDTPGAGSRGNGATSENAKKKIKK